MKRPRLRTKKNFPLPKSHYLASPDCPVFPVDQHCQECLEICECKNSHRLQIMAILSLITGKKKKTRKNIIHYMCITWRSRHSWNYHSHVSIETRLAGASGSSARSWRATRPPWTWITNATVAHCTRLSGTATVARLTGLAGVA